MYAKPKIQKRIVWRLLVCVVCDEMCGWEKYKNDESHELDWLAANDIHCGN